MRESRVRRILLTGEGRVRVGWRLCLFFAVLLLMVVLGNLGVLLLGGTGFRALEGTPGPLRLAVGHGILLFGALAAGSVALALDDRRTAALGFHLTPEAAPELLRGFGVGGGAVLLGIGLVAVAGGLDVTGQEGSVAGWLGAGGRALAVFAIPAAAEEALFRGYPLQAIAESFGRVAALAVTGVLFGLVHLANPESSAAGALNTGLAGVFLAVLYFRTGSLWIATGAHLGWNWAIGFLADLPVSGLELVDTPLYEVGARGPVWLSGAGFGPEGSLLLSAVVAVASVVLWKAPWPPPSPAAVAGNPLIRPPGADPMPPRRGEEGGADRRNDHSPDRESG